VPVHFVPCRPVKRNTPLTVVLSLAAAITCVTATRGVAGDAVAGCRLHSVDKASYVAENEAILRRIPRVPGARRSRSYSIGETASDTCLPVANGEPYGSYTTTYVYGTSTPQRRGAVVRYYRKLLLAQGWRWVARTGSYGPPMDSAFRRRAASLYISEVHQGRGTWIVAVDHAAYARLRN
jgi:hypothetical protein